MNNKLIILANSQSLHAYRITTDDLSTPTNRIEQINVDLPPLETDPVDSSDDDGRFPGGTTVSQASAMKHGEPHGRKEEKQRRLIHNLAQSISKIVELEQCNSWQLAIPSSLSHQLVDQLPADVQHLLTQTKTGDYTHLPINEVESLFGS